MGTGSTGHQLSGEISGKILNRLLKPVMEKDEGTYDRVDSFLIMDRNGYLEETYYTISYTPIPGDKGWYSGNDLRKHR